jgi:hypothetical protein
MSLFNGHDHGAEMNVSNVHVHDDDVAVMDSNGYLNGADMCPSCGTISLIRAEGCRKCLTCGYSEC